MMQAQQASLFLGRIPHPQSGQSAVQLEPAKLFIDHLEMIREKTRGKSDRSGGGHFEQRVLRPANGVCSGVLAGDVSTTGRHPPRQPLEEANKAQEAPPETAPDESKKKFSKRATARD